MFILFTVTFCANPANDLTCPPHINKIFLNLNVDKLVFVLANGSNIRALAREMLNYLVVCDEETKEEVCSKISETVSRYRPSNRWCVPRLPRIVRRLR